MIEDPEVTTNEVMEGLGEIFARLRTVYRHLLAGLEDLDDPGECPAKFIDWLGGNVGLDQSVGLTSQVDETTWRRLVTHAPALWPAKGRPDSYRNLVRAAAGRRVWAGDWFTMRAVAGALTSGYLIATATPSSALDAGSHRMQLHVEDYGEEVDRDLVMQALRLVRQYSERIDVVFVHMVEIWQDLARWSEAGDVALDGNVVTVTGQAVDDSSISLVFGDYPATWGHAIHTAFVRWSGTAGAWFRFRDDGVLQRYEVALPSNGLLALYREGVLEQTATTAVPVGQWVLLRVFTWPSSTGDLQVAVEVNGTRVLDYTDADPMPTGGTAWGADGGGSPGTLDLAWYEVAPGTPEIRTIGGPT